MGGCDGDAGVNLTCLQFDDFAPDALAIRNAVIAQGFKTEKGPDGLNYTGICQYEVPQWAENLSAAMGRKIVVRMSFFRINLAKELPHSWVHSDDICGKFAGVLYLNLPEQCRGGTAFWKHTALHYDRLPAPRNLKLAACMSSGFTQ